MQNIPSQHPSFKIDNVCAEDVEQPDRECDDHHVADLVDSIERVGLLHPVLLRHDLSPVDGLHVLRACKELGWEHIPSHHWCQHVDGMTQLIEPATEPGQTVMGPFLGGGTTAIAALSTNRLFIGADIESSSIATRLNRIEGELQNLPCSAGTARNTVTAT